MPQQRLSTSGDVDDRRQGLREVTRAIGRLRLEGTGSHGVGIAAAVQQEVLVLHVGKAFGIEGHAHEVEVRIEAVNLDRVLDVVGRRTVAVVVGVHVRLARPRVDCLEHAIVDCRQGIGAQDVGSGLHAVRRSPVAWANAVLLRSAVQRLLPTGTRFCRGRT